MPANFALHALTSIALVASFALPQAAQADLKIAVVDLQRAMSETEDGRRAKSKLQKIFKDRQRSLDKLQVELKQKKETLEKQRKVLSRDALQKRLEAYQKDFVALQTKYVEYQRELAGREAELTKGIMARMQAILQRIGQKEGYALIVERNEGGVVWVPGHLDLTDRVIQNYNAGGAGTKGKKKTK
ncbi:MAG: OmpH family outer membrane protein [Polyangiales bacterium]